MPKSQFNVLNIIHRIPGAVTEDAVKFLTASAIQISGAQYFIYSTIRENKFVQQQDIHHHFEDCSPDWRAIYDRRKWFMNDPFVEYARSHTEPIISSQIAAVTTGQSEMIAAAAAHGFRSGMIIPAHNNLGAQQCLGMLLVGSSAGPEEAEPVLLSNRLIYRALAMELMDWWRNQFRQRAIERFKIQQIEMQILAYLHNGKTISEIAALTDIKSGTLYRHLNALKDKLNAVKTDDVVQKAKSYGFFG